MSDYNRASEVPIESLLETVGSRIETYRIARRIKQADLARKAGISSRTLSRLEGGGNGTLETVARVLRALGIEERLLDLVPDASISPLDPRSSKGERRQRVRDSAATASPAWQWGEEDET